MIGFFKKTPLILLLLFLLVQVFPFSGCTSGYQNTENEEIQKINNTEIFKGALCIDYDIDFYSPYMSSVPGLPLKGRFESDNTLENARYHWIAEFGNFLSWDDNGVISELGSDFYNSGEKTYWSPLPSEYNDADKEFRIMLRLEDSSGERVIAEACIQIKKADDGFLVDNSIN